jgi:hypothetical protein
VERKSSDLLRRPRTWIWALFLGAIGGWFQTKGAVISWEEVLTGVIVGGSIGFLLGIMFGLESFKNQ